MIRKAKQSQKAGDGSNQYQAETIIVQNGIDEKRAREICNEMFAATRRELSEEAYDAACRRVNEFENDLIPKMQKIDGALDAFADPAFQFLIADAHKTAASTDRPADYSLLSELLIHRIQRGQNRATIAGISRAVEIVDEIADDALLALSVSFAVEQYNPTSGSIFQGLDVLDSLFEKLCYAELPSGSMWLDHLDILDAIRMSHLGKLKKLEEYYAETMPGYCVAGIKKDTENYAKAQQLLVEAGLPSTIMVNNELDNQYVRLALVSRERISSLSLTSVRIIDGQTIQTTTKLTADQEKNLGDIWNLYDNDASTLERIKAQFYHEILNRPNLRKVQAWWNNVPTAFNTTAVGKVLAHANAKRCDPSLPDLN